MGLQRKMDSGYGATKPQPYGVVGFPEFPECQFNVFVNRRLPKPQTKICELGLYNILDSHLDGW